MDLLHLRWGGQHHARVFKNYSRCCWCRPLRYNRYLCRAVARYTVRLCRSVCTNNILSFPPTIPFDVLDARQLRLDSGINGLGIFEYEDWLNKQSNARGRDKQQCTPNGILDRPQLSDLFEWARYYIRICYHCGAVPCR